MSGSSATPSATPSAPSPGEQAATVAVTIGPVDVTSARAWIRDAETLLSVIGQNDAFNMPMVVVATINRLVDEWRAAATGTEFLWTADVEVSLLRWIASYWAGAASAVRDERHVVPRRPSEDTRLFYNAVLSGVTTALASVDRDGFADAFAGVMPAFDDTIPSPDSGATTVLVVDDTDDIRMLVSIALGADGRFDVVGEARDGFEAIQKAQDLQPDAILLDIAMPRMDGLTALPILLTNCPKSRVVIFSADQSARPAALAAGSHAFVAKTESREVLASALLGR